MEQLAGFQSLLRGPAPTNISGGPYTSESLERQEFAAQHRFGKDEECEAMYNHILIPTDGSPLSSVAIEKGLAFARDAGAKVTILTVAEPFHVFSTESDQLSKTEEEYERQSREQTSQYLREAELKAKTLAVPCEALMVRNDQPYRAIIETAADKGCDLIAMASHGRKGASAILLGSETVKVLTHSTIPVLVYR